VTISAEVIEPLPADDPRRVRCRYDVALNALPDMEDAEQRVALLAAAVAPEDERQINVERSHRKGE
jgi:hypothetical protein